MANRSLNAIMRRLQAAEGYLELELPHLALEELDGIEAPGPFEIPYCWMTAEALKELGRYDDAITPLRHVARTLPMPISRQAWESLGECLEKSGRSAAASDIEQTVKLLEKKSEESAGSGDAASNVRIRIPHIGDVSFKLESGGGELTITIERPER